MWCTQNIAIRPPVNFVVIMIDIKYFNMLFWAEMEKDKLIIFNLYINYISACCCLFLIGQFVNVKLLLKELPVIMLALTLFFF